MEDKSETLATASVTESDFEALVELTSRIFGDQLQFRSAGIEVRGWVPNRATGAVEVRVASDPDSAQAFMDETYGPGRVTVISLARPPASPRAVHSGY